MKTNPHPQTDTETSLPQQEVTAVFSEQCAIVQDLLPLYIEQIVSPASCSFVETHLQQCPLCQAQRNQLQQTLIIPAEQNVKPLQQIQKQQRRNILKTIFTALRIKPPQASMLSAACPRSMCFIFDYGVVICDSD